ncbi:hypothetical protein ABZW10_35850 [Kitasatospora sp. NPDC004723]|uniref:hypothetical protein n=1 Tax=Kitasatospora sp. NPDC004723 TaxID=3154288 RepID=UPI0033A1FE8D
MAGSKSRKDGKARASRESRQRATAQKPTEWFGSAVHSTQGLMHLDVRPAGNGLLITSSPAEAGDRTEAWQLRLRNDDGGQGLRDLAGAFRTGSQHALGGTDRWLAFFPDPQQPGIGSLVSARPGPDPEGPAEILRRADRPLTLWAEAGTAMDSIIASLDTTLPPEQWTPEDVMACPGCLRPVYDSTHSIGMFLGAGMPIGGLCRFCVSGQTLRTVRDAGLVIPEQQRAVLEAMVGA